MKNSKSYWLEWAKKAGVRALKTTAQTTVALIPIGVSVSEVGWLGILGTAALAGVTSLLTSLAGLPELTDSEPKGDE